MNKTCKQCGGGFSIADEDKKFYGEIPLKAAGKVVPMAEPDYCPGCRHQKRLAIRNEMFLYHRKCDYSGEQIVSMFSADKPYVVYDQKIWWSDKWDPLEYGMEVDFSRPFLEQFKELQAKVPRMSLNNINAENSEYCNLACDNKNSYLVYTADFNENCNYCRFSSENYACTDADYTFKSMECYECLDCEQCNRCVYSQKCINSSGLTFCYNMIGCHDCIGCANLRNKTHHIFNKKYSAEEFEAKKKELALGTYSGLEKFRREFDEFLAGQPRKYLEIVNCENSVGDHLRDCKNAEMCYNCVGLEDCKNMINCNEAKNCYDWDFVGLAGSVFCHEMASSALGLNNCHFCTNSRMNQSDLYYCDLCLQSHNLFGCIALRHKEYCILNKQYTKEEYEEMVVKIAEHMTKTGATPGGGQEWGQFFTNDISPFGYNETVAQEYFPLTKEQALEKGWSWKDEEEKVMEGEGFALPDGIDEVGEDVVGKVLKCEKTGKAYKVIKGEVGLLKKLGIALPRISPVQRHKDRMAKVNPWALWARKCDKCGVDIRTTYSSDRAEPVYCEKCYQDVVD